MADLESVLKSFDLERKSLDFKCDRSIINRISGEIIDEWYLLGRALGVSEGRLKSIRGDLTLSSPEEKALAVLEAWVEEYGSKATCLKLAEALYDRKKTNTLERLCEKVQRDTAAAVTSEADAVVSKPSDSQRQQQGDTKKDNYN